MSFECPHCFHKDTSIQPGGTIQEKGVRIKLKVQDKSVSSWFLSQLTLTTETLGKAVKCVQC